MNIVPFQYANHTIRAFADENGEVYFVAADIANILGYGDSSQALRYLDDDEYLKLNQILNPASEAGLPVRYDTNILTEPGLYGLIMNSQKPDAKQFKRWVKHEVLPSIRKTGAYALQPVAPNLEAIKPMLKEVVATEVGRLHDDFSGVDAYIREVVKPVNPNLVAGNHKGQVTKLKKSLDQKEKEVASLKSEIRELQRDIRYERRERDKLNNKYAKLLEQRA